MLYSNMGNLDEKDIQDDKYFEPTTAAAKKIKFLVRAAYVKIVIQKRRSINCVWMNQISSLAKFIDSLEAIVLIRSQKALSWKHDITLAYKDKINENFSNPVCHLCHKCDEAVNHIVKADPVLNERNI